QHVIGYSHHQNATRTQQPVAGSRQPHRIGNVLQHMEQREVVKGFLGNLHPFYLAAIKRETVLLHSGLHSAFRNLGPACAGKERLGMMQKLADSSAYVEKIARLMMG